MAQASDHAAFAGSLTPEEAMLLTLRDELYGHSWDIMMEDLKDRLKGKPFIFKLVNRIEEDIARIEKLRTYEESHDIDLRGYLSDDQIEPSGAKDASESA